MSVLTGLGASAATVYAIAEQGKIVFICTWARVANEDSNFNSFLLQPRISSRASSSPKPDTELDSTSGIKSIWTWKIPRCNEG